MTGRTIYDDAADAMIYGTGVSWRDMMYGGKHRSPTPAAYALRVSPCGGYYVTKGDKPEPIFVGTLGPCVGFISERAQSDLEDRRQAEVKRDEALKRAAVSKEIAEKVKPLQEQITALSAQIDAAYKEAEVPVS